MKNLLLGMLVSGLALSQSAQAHSYVEYISVLPGDYLIERDSKCTPIAAMGHSAIALHTELDREPTIYEFCRHMGDIRRNHGEAPFNNPFQGLRWVTDTSWEDSKRVVFVWRTTTKEEFLKRYDAKRIKTLDLTPYVDFNAVAAELQTYPGQINTVSDIITQNPNTETRHRITGWLNQNDIQVFDSAQTSTFAQSIDQALEHMLKFSGKDGVRVLNKDVRFGKNMGESMYAMALAAERYSFIDNKKSMKDFKDHLAELRRVLTRLSTEGIKIKNTQIARFNGLKSAAQSLEEYVEKEDWHKDRSAEEATISSLAVLNALTAAVAEVSTELTAEEMPAKGSVEPTEDKAEQTKIESAECYKYELHCRATYCAGWILAESKEAAENFSPTPTGTGKQEGIIDSWHVGMEDPRLSCELKRKEVLGN